MSPTGTTARRNLVVGLVPAVVAIWLVGPAGVRSFAAGQPDAVTCSPNGTVVSVIAFDGKFDRKCLAAPAGQALTIDFKNLDRGIPHNVAIYRDQTAQQMLFKGALVEGPGVSSYSVPALPAGRWFFRCDPHPDMNGTFIVGKS
ncbi:MAG TPA: cupredoxin domain-containing protein [Sporichthyaceae bacterium]|nr:cupredoxin domain-containing protein [Sporichthyaceae bacterium]